MDSNELALLLGAVTLLSSRLKNDSIAPAEQERVSFQAPFPGNEGWARSSSISFINN